jgi:hypothetical protein
MPCSLSAVLVSLKVCCPAIGDRKCMNELVTIKPVQLDVETNFCTNDRTLCSVPDFLVHFSKLSAR